ncbi:PREDICTED: limbic system-associated membrane protein-like isoform X2 [Nicrophorus vespilloides]|uniref:Limbic system-associated membrane protein-like isoform X2 n=1 Tax=Nicrophorus vespilloides TaxID=110193 RepID=A0ABM1MKR7_NICVS|nr:PREDICTED: limbic system-associated membrane protein-like isoform X2 [Nicrophorus vespilloides]
MRVAAKVLLVGFLIVGACWCEEQLEFKSVPTTVKALENNTVLLPCYLENANDGIYSTRVRWYRDGKQIADSGPPPVMPPDRFKLWGNGSLEVYTVKPQDTGEYMCEIVRPAPLGEAKQVHAIEVLHAPSVEPDPINGFLEVKLGEEVRMSCKASGVPHPIISWTSKGEDMEFLDNREMLKFTASDRQLAGIYECRAANGVGEPVTAQIELNIIYPPELMTTRSWIHSAPGLRAQLDCRVSADPQAVVTWLKSEIPVNLDSRVVSLVDGDKHSLLIRDIQRSDFGIYTCRASNDLGQGDVQIQLSGVPNPGVFKRTDEKNLESKNSYTLIWEVDSYTPIIEYNLWFRLYRPQSGLHRPDWTKLTIPTEHSTNSGPMYSKLYTIKGLKEKTIYEALLVSRNRYGWSKPSPILRFATVGADLKEEIITPMQVETENTIIPLEITTAAKSASPQANCFFIIVITLYILLQLK